MEKSWIPVKSRTSMPLPLLVLYTQNGSIPFLSWNFIHQFNNEILFHSKNDDEEINFVKLNVGDFFDYLDESGGDHDHRLSSMKYFKNCSFILSLFDPLRNSKDFYKSNDQKIAIETYQGKKMLSVDDMLKLSRTIGVDHVQSLADIITPPIAGRKWTNKSVDRSNKFLDEIISRQQEEDSDHRVKLWATVTGGFQHESRYRSCKKIFSYSDRLQAIIIDGFFGYKTSGQDNDDDLEENPDDFQQILTVDIIPNLPEQIPKVLFGCFYPDTIIRLIRSGIQIFDSSICTLLTNRGRALPSPLISNVEPKLLFERSAEMIDDDDDPNPSIILDLNNISYKNSDRLISNKCKCYTCNHGFTRSYINHLLKRNEINSRILLQIHNHYVLTEFFSRIRLIIIDGYFDQLLVNSNINVDDKFSQPQPPLSTTTLTSLNGSLSNGK